MDTSRKHLLETAQKEKKKRKTHHTSVMNNYETEAKKLGSLGLLAREGLLLQAADMLMEFSKTPKPANWESPTNEKCPASIFLEKAEQCRPSDQRSTKLNFLEACGAQESSKFESSMSSDTKLSILTKEKTVNSSTWNSIPEHSSHTIHSASSIVKNELEAKEKHTLSTTLQEKPLQQQQEPSTKVQISNIFRISANVCKQVGISHLDSSLCNKILDLAERITISRYVMVAPHADFIKGSNTEDSECSDIPNTNQTENIEIKKSDTSVVRFNLFPMFIPCNSKSMIDLCSSKPKTMFGSISIDELRKNGCTNITAIYIYLIRTCVKHFLTYETQFHLKKRIPKVNVIWKDTQHKDNPMRLSQIIDLVSEFRVQSPIAEQGSCERGYSELKGNTNFLSTTQNVKNKEEGKTHLGTSNRFSAVDYNLLKARISSIGTKNDANPNRHTRYKLAKAHKNGKKINHEATIPLSLLLDPKILQHSIVLVTKNLQKLVRSDEPRQISTHSNRTTDEPKNFTCETKLQNTISEKPTGFGVEFKPHLPNISYLKKQSHSAKKKSSLLANTIQSIQSHA